MEPTKEVGGLISGLGTYAHRTIVGVWFPGFIVFLELSWLAYKVALLDNNPVRFLKETVGAGDSGVVLAVFIIITISLSVYLGYLTRDLGFAVSNWCIRRYIPPTRTLDEVLTVLGDVYGSENVSKVTSRYPVFLLRDKRAVPRSLPRTPESYVRDFCKTWLSLTAPQLSTEGMETEINLVIGLVVPALLFSFLTGTAISGLIGLLLALIVFFASAFLLYRVNWVRDLETELAIRNFLFAHWEARPGLINSGLV
jgi:hypothetical protein